MSDEITLDERVTAFKCFELPGQPVACHMGTSYLVNDLWREVVGLRAERDAMKELLNVKD